MSRLMVIALILAMALVPVNVKAVAQLVGGTSNVINIWSEGGGHVETCDSFMASINKTATNSVKPCLSPYAAYCIAVNGTINVTAGSITNHTNFTIDNCEVRFNVSASNLNDFIIWGNVTVKNGNITTNETGMYMDFIVQQNSNFSSLNSFYSGFQNDGLGLSSPVFKFTNNTIYGNTDNGLTLNNGANGSLITGLTSIYNKHGIYVVATSNNTFTGIVANNNTQNGIELGLVTGTPLANTAMNNKFYNVFANRNTNNGIYLAYSKYNSFDNVTVQSNIGSAGHGVNFYFAENNSLSNFTVVNCSTISASNYDCLALQGSSSNIFTQGVLNNTRRYIASFYTSPNTTLKDMLLINTSYFANGIDSQQGSYETFINVSEQGTSENIRDTSMHTRQWYLDAFSRANVIKTGINISVWNSTGNLINSSPTNSTGWFSRYVVTQYVNTGGVIANTNNHTIQANWSGNQNKTISWNIGAGTSGTTTAGTLAFGDWAQNNTRLNLSLTTITPNVTSATADSGCYEIGGGATITWFQQDDVLITNSSCLWTYPSGFKNSQAAVTTNGLASCTISLPELGTYQWQVFLNDTSGSEANYYAAVTTKTTGSCSSIGGGPGGGGGGGGGAPFVPTPLNISLEPIITQETIQALPASQFVALITRPVAGPFNLFQIAIVGAAIYYATRKGRSQQDILLVGAVSIMLIIAIASQLGGLGALQSIIRP